MSEPIRAGNDPGMCATCGRPDLEHDFGEFLSHLLEVPLEQGRDLQERIVRRIERAQGIHRRPRGNRP